MGSLLRDLLLCAVTDKNPFESNRRKRNSIYDNGNETVSITVHQSQSITIVNEYDYNDYDDDEYNDDSYDDDDDFEPPNLEELVRECDNIYIDTCSIMEIQFQSFLDIVTPLLEKYNKKIYVMEACINELIKHIGNQDVEKANAAKRGLDSLNVLKQKQYLYINNTGGGFADAEYLSYFMKYRIRHSILFITQDKNLASDVNNLNFIQSVDGENIDVCYILDDGNLDWCYDDYDEYDEYDDYDE